MTIARTPTIFYFCPDVVMKSAGIRTLYRHVSHLVKNGLQAAILHQNAGFQMPEVIPVPVRYLSVPGSLIAGDIVVIPEGLPNVMLQLKDAPLRRIAIAQNWSYVYVGLPEGTDWRHLGIERILTYPEHTGEFLSWAMNLPVHVFEWGIRDDLFYFRREEKERQITYIKRKQHNIEILKRVLCSRRPNYISDIRWLALDGLSEEDYAREIRRSTVFLSLSTAEGLYAPFFEAMRSGTLVGGYHGVGAQRALIPSGPNQNCVIAENEDYITLARRLEPLLADLLKGDLSDWQKLIDNGLQTSARYTLEREEASIVAIWREILAE
jgi:hypothetical protein